MTNQSAADFLDGITTKKRKLPHPAVPVIASHMTLRRLLPLFVLATATLLTGCALDDNSSQDPGVKTSDNTPFRSEPVISDFYNSSYEESLYSPFSFN